MKLFKTAARFVRSPQGREAIQRAREKYDTPENRERAKDVFNDLRTRLDEKRKRPPARGR
jgi:hypothetical protein